MTRSCVVDYLDADFSPFEILSWKAFYKFSRYTDQGQSGDSTNADDQDSSDAPNTFELDTHAVEKYFETF